MNFASLSYKKIHPSLPIFLVGNNSTKVLYTPGIVHKATSEIIKLIENELESELFIGSAGKLQRHLESVFHSARDVVARWKRFVEQPFSPTCLTINLSNNCNLDCSYCFVEKNSPRNVLDLQLLKATAEAIVKNCVKQNKTFVVVLNGGGEPTYDWQRLIQAIAIVDKMAKTYKIDLFKYIATNGVLEKKQVLWLAENFDLLSISCDGPPEIHDELRGWGTSEKIAETVKILNRSNSRFQIRTTVTKNTLPLQESIAEYLITVLNSGHIVYEPEYSAKETKFSLEDAAEFTKNFIKAESFAKQHNCSLAFSGVRINELHGPYCHVLRDTVHINTKGQLVNCFYRAENPLRRDLISLVANGEEENIFKKSLAMAGGDCLECLNLYHCSRGCPDTCSIIENRHLQVSVFKCQLHRLLAVHWIMEKATRV